MNGFGTPVRRLPALRRQAASSSRSAALLRDLGDDRRARRARRLRRLVDRADRLPEGRRLDDALGDARARLRLDAADLPLLAADRRRPLLAAAGHHAPAAVAGQGAADRAARAGRSLDVALYAGVLALRCSTCCSPARSTPAPASPAASTRPRSASLLGAARRARAARQGPVPRRPAGGLRLLLVVFLFPLENLIVGCADRLRLHLVGRGLLEAQPPLPLRGLGDDQQHALEPLAQGEGAALPRPPRGPAPVARCGSSPRTSAR